ncbi:hypothetical protein ON010_g14765 [Phytophthora cinnamomi]|nr:hypothetical protein ON010_g14765 [Phytophthora cinnamomi]
MGEMGSLKWALRFPPNSSTLFFEVAARQVDHVAQEPQADLHQAQPVALGRLPALPHRGQVGGAAAGARAAAVLALPVRQPPRFSNVSIDPSALTILAMFVASAARQLPGLLRGLHQERQVDRRQVSRRGGAARDHPERGQGGVQRARGHRLPQRRLLRAGHPARERGRAHRVRHGGGGTGRRPGAACAQDAGVRVHGAARVPRPGEGRVPAAARVRAQLHQERVPRAAARRLVSRDLRAHQEALAA